MMNMMIKGGLRSIEYVVYSGEAAAAAAQIGDMRNSVIDYVTSCGLVVY